MTGTTFTVEAIAAIIDPVAFDPISLANKHPGWECRRERATETAQKIAALADHPPRPSAHKVRDDSTCYIERSAVRQLLIEQPDENLNITELILAEVDALPIFSASDFREEPQTPSDIQIDSAFANGARAVLNRLDHLRRPEDEAAWLECEAMYRNREAEISAARSSAVTHPGSAA